MPIAGDMFTPNDERSHTHEHGLCKRSLECYSFSSTNALRAAEICTVCVRETHSDQKPFWHTEAVGLAAARASKQAKRVDDIWGKLRAQSGGSASISAPSPAQPGTEAAAAGGAGNGSAAAQRASGPGIRFNVADFCRPVPKRQKGVQDEVQCPKDAPSNAKLVWWMIEFSRLHGSFVMQSWKRQLGLGPQKQQAATSSGQPGAVAVAAAALEAAKATATTDQYGRTVVTETRKFAGQTIQVNIVWLHCMSPQNMWRSGMH